MFNGGLIGLLSGGTIDQGMRRAEKRERKEQRRAVRRGYQYSRDDGRSPAYITHASEPGYFDGATGGQTQAGRQRGPRRRNDQSGAGMIRGAVKKVMQEDVLYLMIVPMPSEAELAEAREMLRREKEKK